MKKFLTMVAAAMLTAAPAAAAPITYQFDLISKQVAGFIPVSADGINNAGQVLFRAALPANLQLVRGDGTTQVAIATSGGGSEFQNFFPVPTLNESGEVAFAARLATTSAAFVSDEFGTTALVDTNGPIAFFNGNRPVDLNDAGQVVLNVTLDPAPGLAPERSIMLVENGVVSEVLNSATSEFFAFDGPSINESGDIAFRATTDASETAVAVVSGGSIRTIADSSGPFDLFSQIVSLNNSSDVAFTASFDAGGAAIYATTGGVLNEVVSTTNTSFTAFSRPSINDYGDIAFTSSDASGVVSLNIFHDGLIKTILSTGEALDGLLVVGLFLGFDFLNENGDIAFLALFEDGSRSIYRATAFDASEVPAPAALSLFILGIGTFAAARKRRAV